MNGRRKPYTTRGIARLPCSRCGARPSRYQWQICSDSNTYRTLCAPCDLELNRLVLEWVGFPDWREKFDRYAAAEAAR
jgi:hypothetical protein